MKKRIFIALVLLVGCFTLLRGDTLATIFSLDISHDLKKVVGSSITHDKGDLRISQGFIDGNATDSAEADVVIAMSAEVSSATATVIDLNAVVDPFGNTTDLDVIKIFALKNLDAADSITIGSGTSSWAGNMATGTVVTVAPLGIYLISAPYAGISVATPAYINLNCADVATYDLRIIGTE